MVLGLHFLHLSTKKERIYIPKIDKEMGREVYSLMLTQC